MHVFINNTGWALVTAMFFNPSSPGEITSIAAVNTATNQKYRIDSVAEKWTILLSKVCIPALEYNMKNILHATATDIPELTPLEKRNIDLYLKLDALK